MLPITKPVKKVPTHGPGTTAWYRGKEAKILAIENGKAKIFCDGKVLLVNYTSLDDASFKTLHEAYRNGSHKVLYTGTKSINESLNEEQVFNAYRTFEDTLKLAKSNLPVDIFKLFAKEYFIANNDYILDKIVEETLKVVDASPINDLVKMAKTYNNGNYSDRINKFIYNTNNLRSLQTGVPFNQRYFDKCLNLLMAFGTSPFKALDEITANSIMFVPRKNQLGFYDLSTDCIEAIGFVVSKQSNWNVVKQTPNSIVLQCK